MKKYLSLVLAIVILALALASCGSSDAISGKQFDYSSCTFDYKGKTADDFYHVFDDEQTEDEFIELVKSTLTAGENQRFCVSEDKGADNVTLDGKKVDAYGVNYLKTDDIHAQRTCFIIPVEGQKNQYLFYDIKAVDDTNYSYEPFKLIKSEIHGSNNSGSYSRTLTAEAVKIEYNAEDGTLALELKLVATSSKTGEADVTAEATMKVMLDEHKNG